MQQLHGGLHAGEGALAAAEIGARLKAFNGDGGDEVAHAQHLVGKGLVDERAVGEGEEHTVVVALAERDDVLFAHQRLTAGVDEHADAEFLGLHDDGIQRVKVHVELVAVLGCPAAGAMEVAGAGGVHQDGPGHVAVVLLHGGSAARRPEEVRIDDKVFKQLLAHVVVHVVPEAADQTVPVVAGVGDRPADRVALGGKGVGSVHLVCQFHQLGEVGIGVFVQVSVRLLDRCDLKVLFDSHDLYSFLFEDCAINLLISIFSIGSVPAGFHGRKNGDD